MTDADRLRLVEQLQRHEGVRLFPYVDTVGKLTIGVGRNLTDRGISEDECDYLLGNDMNGIEDDLRRTFPWFLELDSVRQAAMIELGFIGLTKLLTFERALRAMAAKDYVLAASEFYASNLPKPGQWGPVRTRTVTEMIRTGAWVK